MTRPAFESGQGTTPGKGRIYSSTGFGDYHRDYERTINPESGTSDIITTGTSGQNETQRYRDMSNDMAHRDAYQADWPAADRDRQQGTESRGAQNDALNLQRSTAQFGNLPAYGYGQSLLDKGVQTQTAGALSARGGPLAQMAALGNARTNEAGFRQRGMTALNAQRADDMAQGREQYMYGATGIRDLDQRSQSLAQQQAETQAKSEQAQRDLNQQGRQTLDKLGFDVTKQTVDANIRERSALEARADTNARASEARDDRWRQGVAAGISAIGTIAGKASDARVKDVTSFAELTGSKTRGALAVQADANRKLQGSPYRYKAGVDGEDPERLHFGPMAQEMEKNPITATAVRVDPETGIKMVDTGAAWRVTLAQLANVQHQIDALKKRT